MISALSGLIDGLLDGLPALVHSFCSIQQALPANLNLVMLWKM